MAQCAIHDDRNGLDGFDGLDGLDDLGGLGGPDGFAELHKNRLLVYQEPVLIAISEFGTLALSCSSF